MSQTVPSTPAPTASLPPPRRRRWWVSLGLALVIFASGCIVGGTATLLVARNRILHALHHPEEGPARIAARLKRKLDLTDEQTKKVEAILARRQAALAAIRRRVQPEVESQLDLVESEIAEVLDDSQRAEWRQRIEALRATWLPPKP